MAVRLAIDGGEKVKTTPYGSGKRLGKAEEDAVVEVIRSQTLFYAHGRKVHEAEEAFCRMYASKHAVACSSGTAAVHTALAVCGVGSGDEVIVNPLTDWGSVMGILALGAVPVFADIEEETYSLDPDCVAELITPRTRAIEVVHLFGYPARIREIVEIARSRGVKTVEDCAQSHCAFIDGKALGTFGDVGTFSTNDWKHVTCGEGGVVITDDDEMARASRLFIDKGYDRSPDRVRGDARVNFLAFNYRMSELNGAVLVAQLRSLPRQVKRLREYHARVVAGIGELAGYTPLKPGTGVEGSFWGILGHLDPEQFTVDRSVIVKALTAEGTPVGTGLCPTGLLYNNPVLRDKSIHPMDPNRQAEFLADADYHDGLCPTAESIDRRVLVMPCSQFFTDTDADETGAAMRKVLEHYHV